MADRNLPLGQITPTARPIGAFVQAARTNPAAPAQPAQLGNPSGISTIQVQSGGNVTGFNQYEQLAAALAPFNKALLETAGQGYLALRKGQIEEGYYETKNQLAKATLSLQVQAEAGAADAASQIGQLEKVDPIAAQLLDESNPWKLIGRRRALAQVAGGEISGVLEDDLITNAGELSSLPPDSPELSKRQVQLTSQVLDRFGLTGDEPEVQFYVTPKLNKAWDQYRDQQRKLYQQEVKASTIATSVAAVGEELQQLARDGITVNGETVPVTDPRWAALAGYVLTAEVDKTLSMLGGSDRAEAVAELREQLQGSYGQVSVLSDAIGNIRGGNPGMPFEKRPTWGASNPLDLLELRNRGNDARMKDYELGQKGIEQKLTALWYQQGSPGALLPADPNYPAALINFRNQAAAMGYRDIDGFMNSRMSATESVLEKAYRPDPLAQQNFLNEIEDAPPSLFSSPDGLRRLRDQAAKAARAEPTPELQAEAYRNYNEAIERKRQQAEEFTPGVKQQVDQSLLQDLALPEVKKKLDAGKSGGSSMMQSLLQQGVDPASAAASAFGRSEAVAFTIGVQNLYLRTAEDALNKWREDNPPGRAMSPAAKNRIISQAIADARKSKSYEDLYSTLTGMKPGQVGQGTVGTGPSQGGQPGPQVRGVPRARASSLPDSTAKAYAARPVMDGGWLHSELDNINKGKPVSNELYNLAKRAGTSTTRYLLDQLRFYPQLDPDGSASQYLLQRLRQERQGQQVSSANYRGATGGLAMVPTGYNPLAPGSWLMNLLMPPAAAATLPTPRMVPSGVGGGAQPTGDVGALRAAIIGKESGGNYSAVNPDSGALGIGQVMPENVGPWTQKYLGRRLTPEQFLRDRNAQDTVINGRFNDMLADQQKAGYSGEQAIRRAAAVWYSGRANLWNDTKPQYSNGRRYPSVAEYTKAIWESYKRNGGEVGRRSAAEPDAALADQLVAQLSNQNGYEDVAALDLRGIVKRIEAAVQPATKAIYAQFDKLFNREKAKPSASGAPAPKDTNARIAAAAEAFKGQSTAAGPDGGRKACAWAINKVLNNAGVKVPWVEAGQESIYIPFIEDSIRKGAGKQVTYREARPGDLIVIDGQHMGIVTTQKSPGNNYMFLSNSSNRSSFSYGMPLMPERFGATYYRLNPQGGR